jgi:hypothetical protein
MDGNGVNTKGPEKLLDIIMMTEDDTFRFLTRCTWLEMRKIYRDSLNDITHDEWCAMDLNEIFKQHGWTSREFYSMKYKMEQQRKGKR